MQRPDFKTEQNSQTFSTATVEIFDVEAIAMPPGTKAMPRPRGNGQDSAHSSPTLPPLANGTSESDKSL
jgi:hypothetical protein